MTCRIGLLLALALACGALLAGCQAGGSAATTATTASGAKGTTATVASVTTAPPVTAPPATVAPATSAGPTTTEFNEYPPLPDTLWPVPAGSGYGYIDSTGKLAIPAKYEGAAPYSDWMASVEVDGKWGFIDDSGKMVIAPQFAGPSAFHDDMAREKKGTKWGYVDDTGDWVIPAVYDAASDFSDDGLAAVRLGGKALFVDESGRRFSGRYDDARPPSDTMTAVKVGDLWGYLGVTPIAPQFQQAGDFAEGVAPVEKDGKWGYIDSWSGGPDVYWQVQPTYEAAQSFSQDMAAVEVGGKWGYVDKTCEPAIQPQFLSAGPFSFGRAAVKLASGAYAYIDETGVTKITGDFTGVSTFKDGLALVSTKDSLLVIDTLGKTVYSTPLPASGAAALFEAWG